MTYTWPWEFGFQKLARVRTCSPVLTAEIKDIILPWRTITYTFSFIYPLALYSVYFELMSLLFIFFILWFIHKIESGDVHSFRNCNIINNSHFHISRLGGIDCNASLHLHWAVKWMQSWKHSCWRLTHLSKSFVCSTCVNPCVCLTSVCFLCSTGSVRSGIPFGKLENKKLNLEFSLWESR